MVYRRLVSGHAAPAAGLVLFVSLFAWTILLPGLYAVKALLGLASCLMLRLLWSRTRRTNLLVARFVNALQHRDLMQTFRMPDRGSGFEELGAALDGALGRLREDRLTRAAEARFSAALVDEAPTPLLAVDAEGIVHLANKASRRLFRELNGHAADRFRRYGEELADVLSPASAAGRRICRVRSNGLLHRAVVTVALVERRGRPWRIVSLQIIQNELDAAELATQTDLVRVLTHEIMNSLTPVTSLAASAAQMLGNLDANYTSALEDARLAVEALARRASGIAHFVETYRVFSDTPSVEIMRFRAQPWLEELVRSFRATSPAANVALDIRLASDGLMLAADPDLLGQVVLNLLKNAGQAVEGRAMPQIELEVEHDMSGRTVLRVSDNGAGIPAELEEEIFLPFFTTKSAGTGVGLSFAKQIALLHGGVIGVVPSKLGGAAIQLIF